jgi:DNA polymerase
MEKCYPNLEAEIEILKPSLIFLLGKQTGTFLLERFSRKLLSLDDDFHYDSFLINGITYIPIHHPSYILVYKRRNVKDYIRSIQSIFEMSLIPSVTCY